MIEGGGLLDSVHSIQQAITQGTMTDQAYVNRIIGTVYTDLGYLVDVGAITDEDYEEITKRIPRRFRGQPKVESLNVSSLAIGDAGQSNDRRKVPSAPTGSGSPAPAAVSMAQAMRLNNNNNNSNPNNNGRQTPQPPQQQQQQQPQQPQAPQLMGVGQAEALYDYHSGDAGDLDFERGESVLVLEYVNADWWRGSNGAGREGIFPSNYVRKTSDQGRPLEPVSQQAAQQYPTVPTNQYNPQDYRPVQYAQPQGQQGPVTVVENKKTGKLGKIGGRVGDAAVTGAGFAIGASLVNAIL